MSGLKRKYIWIDTYWNSIIVQYLRSSLSEVFSNWLEFVRIFLIQNGKQTKLLTDVITVEETKTNTTSWRCASWIFQRWHGDVTWWWRQRVRTKIVGSVEWWHDWVRRTERHLQRSLPNRLVRISFEWLKGYVDDDKYNRVQNPLIEQSKKSS